MRRITKLGLMLGVLAMICWTSGRSTHLIGEQIMLVPPGPLGWLPSVHSLPLWCAISQPFLRVVCPHHPLICDVQSIAGDYGIGSCCFIPKGDVLHCCHFGQSSYSDQIRLRFATVMFIRPFYPLLLLIFIPGLLP
jgi:hypothetical protein